VPWGVASNRCGKILGASGGTCTRMRPRPAFGRMSQGPDEIFNHAANSACRSNRSSGNGRTINETPTCQANTASSVAPSAWRREFRHPNHKVAYHQCIRGSLTPNPKQHQQNPTSPPSSRRITALLTISPRQTSTPLHMCTRLPQLMNIFKHSFRWQHFPNLQPTAKSSMIIASG